MRIIKSIKKKPMDFQDKAWQKDHPTVLSVEFTEFDHKYGPWIGGGIVVFCTLLLFWLVWIDWRDATSGKYKQENLNCPGELQISGYCCSSQAMFDSGNCTNYSQ